MSKTDIFNLDLLEINHVDSTQNKCIQAVDFVVGAIAKNYEREEPLFCKIIDGKIKIALGFFKGKIK